MPRCVPKDAVTLVTLTRSRSLPKKQTPARWCHKTVKIPRFVIVTVAVLGLGAALWAAVRYMNGAGGPADTEPGATQTIRLYREPKPLPSFTVTTLEGRTITSSSLRGKVVLINFWATWCPP